MYENKTRAWQILCDRGLKVIFSSYFFCSHYNNVMSVYLVLILFLDFFMSVANLSVTFTDETTIILQWMYVIPLEHRINISTVEIDIDSSHLKATIMIGSTATSAVFDTLQPLKDYFFSVYVVTAAGRSPPSEISATTLSRSMQ